jgi:hypothetical protein
MPDPPPGFPCEVCRTRHLRPGRCIRDHIVCDDCWIWVGERNNYSFCPVCRDMFGVVAMEIHDSDDSDEDE